MVAAEETCHRGGARLVSGGWGPLPAVGEGGLFLAIVYVATSYGLLGIARWAWRRFVGQLGGLGRLLTRALPLLMEKLERLGCSKSVVGLVVPTGYSFNLDGTNIYMTLAALFIAQAVGIDLSLGEQLTLVLVAMVSSKGAAGVTGAGFVILAATLSVVPSVPVAGMALILGIDRFMSECRALTNFIGNAVATIVVAKWENALDTQRLAAAMAGSPMPLPEADIEHHERTGPYSEGMAAAIGEAP